MYLFTHTLKDLRSGQADIDIGAALGELVAAVRETGRGGILTVAIKVKPVNTNDGSQVTVEDNIKVMKPTPQRGVTVLYTTPDNALARKDPRQPELPTLRDVNKVTEFPEKKEGTVTA